MGIALFAGSRFSDRSLWTGRDVSFDSARISGKQFVAISGGEPVPEPAKIHVQRNPKNKNPRSFTRGGLRGLRTLRGVAFKCFQCSSQDAASFPRSRLVVL